MPKRNHKYTSLVFGHETPHGHASSPVLPHQKFGLHPSGVEPEVVKVLTEYSSCNGPGTTNHRQIARQTEVHGQVGPQAEDMVSIDVQEPLASESRKTPILLGPTPFQFPVTGIIAGSSDRYRWHP